MVDVDHEPRELGMQDWVCRAQGGSSASIEGPAVKSLRLVPVVMTAKLGGPRGRGGARVKLP